jgi:FAD/FMN-containing dehydrogenase
VNEIENAVRAIDEALPAGAISTDPHDLETYGRDWTRVHEPAPSAIVWPRSTAEIATVLSICDRERAAVVPSGGRTGLAGGAIAKGGEIVLSLARMDRIGAIDPIAMTVRVEAGAITEKVHLAAAEHGLTWPVDFASKGSSHVGGNIATNAGGVKVIRYGLTRQWVLGLTVVTAKGETLELNGALEKNNTGVDLRQLFIGSEGTLGVISEATLKLARLPGHLDVFLFATRDLSGVLSLFEAARRGPFTVMAFEMFTDRCLARLTRHRGLTSPLDAAPYFALLEVEAPEREALDGWLGELLENDYVTDGTLAQSREQAAHLWSLREGISESLSATGLPHKNDVSLPIAELSSFCASLDRVFEERYPGWEICLFGHIGDGNLHVNVMKPDAMSKTEFLAHTHESDRAMFELVRAHKGSISAEHGIGLLKKEWLRYARSDAEIEIMKSLKRALDPNGILNPGKIFDL